jgi:Toprim domain-containing protein
MQNDIRDYFEQTWDTGEGFRALCPRCDDTVGKFYFNIDKAVGCCFHADCLWSSTRGGVGLFRLRAFMRREGVRFAKPSIQIERPKDNAIVLPKEYKLLDELEAPLRKSIYAYLKEDRGLMRQTLQLMKVGYCEKGKFWGYIIFPVFDLEGTVVYWQGRRFKSRTPKFWNPASSSKKEICYQIGGTRETHKIVIVESIINALTLVGADIPTRWAVIALLGKTMSEQQKERILGYEKSLHEIVIALDPDTRKKNEHIDIAQKLSGYGFVVRLAKFPEGEDVNSVGRLKAWELIHTAELYQSDNETKMRAKSNTAPNFGWRDDYAHPKR